MNFLMPTTRAPTPGWLMPRNSQPTSASRSGVVPRTNDALELGVRGCLERERGAASGTAAARRGGGGDGGERGGSGGGHDTSLRALSMT